MLTKEYFSPQFARRCVFTQPRPNADFKSFVLSVMKMTSDRAVMAVTCAHYRSANNVQASWRSLVSKPSTPKWHDKHVLGTGATRSPSSRQQLVEQEKARLKAGLFVHWRLS
jgi:hypothetical protein